ncbi:CB068 protein, partial [Molothrus ater]|nr:CB068 protein [Molothrus ater]
MEAAPATAAAPGWRCRPGGRLDMSHGFVRHIRRNQLARDAYDRAVRQARGRARTRLTPGPARPRRPDQQVYRPHRGGERGHRGERGNPGGPGEPGGPAGGSGAPPEPARGPRLFCLEYEGDDGRVTAVIVHQGDSAEEVTRRVCAHSPLEPPLRRALCQRVQDELSKRRGTG